MFQSTHSLRSATIFTEAFPRFTVVSIHALLAECDCAPTGGSLLSHQFQSTHSLRSATGSRAAEGGRVFVSIHALLAECDCKVLDNLPERNVSIHALLAECDHCLQPVPAAGKRFQSTHSLRSATPYFVHYPYSQDVSIHALLAECDFYRTRNRRCSYVSIHALLAECDCAPTGGSLLSHQFQSTHSLRSATDNLQASLYPHSVSIHALLAECDGFLTKKLYACIGFNPRTPCGVRPCIDNIEVAAVWFQSTHSLRSATLRFLNS